MTSRNQGLHARSLCAGLLLFSLNGKVASGTLRGSTLWHFPPITLVQTQPPSLMEPPHRPRCHPTPRPSLNQKPEEIFRPAA